MMDKTSSTRDKKRRKKLEKNKLQEEIKGEKKMKVRNKGNQN